MQLEELEAQLEAQIEKMPLSQMLLALRSSLIQSALQEMNGNITCAGELLGIQRTNLTEQIKSLKIDLKEFRLPLKSQMPVLLRRVCSRCRHFFKTEHVRNRCPMCNGRSRRATIEEIQTRTNDSGTYLLLREYRKP